MHRRTLLAAAPAVLLGPLASTALPKPPAPGFTPPAPGSYALPAIQPATNGWVLEDSWWPRRLSGYTQGQLTLLSFVYTYCSDPQGCPLAYEAFVDLHRLAQADPLLRQRLRLVSLSFDPGNDTPQAMRAYGGRFASAATPRWHFLTTYSLRFLQPILDGFGQDVAVDTASPGSTQRVLTHLLKVFLIDAGGWVREIYSTAFLNPQVMFNDLHTLALEERATRRGP